MTVISTLVLGTLGAGKLYVDRSLHALQNTAQPTAAGAPTVSGRGALKPKPKTGQPFTVLILGTDSRTGTTAYGTNADACGCSDTIILARVNPQTQKVSLLSIPRDTRVFVTGYNRTTKINSAYGKGPDNTVATIEQALNIDINHWIVLDLAGFKSIVDAIGGIKMDFPMQVTDKNAGLFITKTGCQTINGTTALAISRSRELKYLDPKTGTTTFDPTYEYGRARREQIMMKVIAAHTVKKSLGNPLTAQKVISTFTSHNRLAIDNQVTSNELVNLVGDFAGFDAAAMQTFTLPTFTKSLYDAGAGKDLDFEILQQDKDVATIQAWYNATLKTAKPTAQAPSASTQQTSGDAPARPTGDTSSPATRASAAAGSRTTETASSNEPQPWDPRPCS